MQPTVLIDGTDRTRLARAGGLLHIAATLGARTTAEVQLRDYDSLQTAYRLPLDARVEIRQGATSLFTGAVASVTDNPLGNPGVGTVSVGKAGDNWSAASKRRVSQTYVAGTTLRTIVSDLVTTYLAVWGITLDPGMPAGPVMTADVVFDVATVEDACQRLSVLTGWVYRLTPTNVLEWFAIGDRALPITFSAANKNIVGPITWSRSSIALVNIVILRYGTGLVTRSDAFTGDGSRTVFALSYPMAKAGSIHYPDIPVGGDVRSESWVATGVAEADQIERYHTKYPSMQDYYGIWPNLVYLTKGAATTKLPAGWAASPAFPTAPELSIAWTWEAIYHTLIHDQTYSSAGPPPLDQLVTPAGTVIGPETYTTVDSEGVGDGWLWKYDAERNAIVAPWPVAAGVAFTFDYSVQYPLTTAAENPDDLLIHPPSEEVYEAPEIFDLAAADAYAQSLLRRYGPTPRTVVFPTQDPTRFLPGDTVMLDVPSRTLPNARWLIVDVAIVDWGTDLLRTLTLLEGNEAQGSWIDFWRQALGTGSGSPQGIVTGSVVPGGATTTPPVTTVSGGVAQPPVYFLGGTPTTYVQSPTPDWVPADGTPPGQSGTECVIDTVARNILTGTVRARLRAAAGSVTARLFDLDQGVAVGTSTAYTGIAFGSVSFTVALTAGAHRYQLQLLPSLANSDVNGIGYLE